ncbi:MAG: hypothetical protein JNM84_02715 [Planctomycetes bacterium]|nr:hypothetical protein [Planctomycetota bacterium]
MLAPTFLGWMLCLVAHGTPVPQPPASRVWIVDASGGGDFTDLPAALQAVSFGDMIQIEAGTYAGGLIPHAITLRGRGAATRIEGALRASGLNEPGTLIIASLTLARVWPVPGGATVPGCTTGGAVSTYPHGGLRFDSCTTPIHVHDVRAEGFQPGQHRTKAGGPSLIARRCDSLMLVQSTFRCLGATGLEVSALSCPSQARLPLAEVDAAVIEFSHAVIDRCTFEGAPGYGSWGWCNTIFIPPTQGSTPGLRGGDALILKSSRVVLNASLLQGGRGANNHYTLCCTWCRSPCEDPTPGGHGVRLQDLQGCDLAVFATASTGGVGGDNVDLYGCMTSLRHAADGSTLLGTPRSLRIENYGLPVVDKIGALRTGSPFQLSVDAWGAGPVAVYLGTRWFYVRTPSTAGGTLLDPTTGVSFLLGVTHARGSLTVALERDPSLLGLQLFFQPIQWDARSGLMRLGAVVGDAVSG